MTTPEEQYIRGYEQYPETQEKLEWVEAASKKVLEENPWEEDEEQ